MYFTLIRIVIIKCLNIFKYDIHLIITIIIIIIIIINIIIIVYCLLLIVYCLFVYCLLFIH